MGGLGKTTLAKAVFNELASKFEYTCFVPDAKLSGGSEKALKEEVWNCMYYNGEKVGGDSDWSRLCGKQLLLVLDDVEQREIKVLLEIASGPSAESRFIATSRMQRLLPNTYPVPLLDEEYSYQLFISRAFPNQATPPANLASLTVEIVKKCEKLPLTLEVVGQWLKNTQTEEDWKQALSALVDAEAFTDFNEVVEKVET
ncbi:unnamed protein product [Calypogeia fissa]